MAMVRTVFSPSCLRDFQNHLLAADRDGQRVQDRRQVAIEVDIDNRAQNLASRARLHYSP